MKNKKNGSKPKTKNIRKKRRKKYSWEKTIPSSGERWRQIERELRQFRSAMD